MRNLMLSSASATIAVIGGVSLLAGPALAANPDLSGIWGGAVVTAEFTAGDPNANIDKATFEKLADSGSGRYTARNDLAGRQGGARWIAHESDKTVRRRGALNKPVYKPEFWETIALNDYNANVGGEWIDYADPKWKSLPLGVPRMGAPSRIIQGENEVVFLYASYGHQFRVIPTTCGPFDPVLEYDSTFMGTSVGCWENGTLVVHSKGFNDQTWLDETGWSHSDQMEVWERFTLSDDGKKMLYEVEVADPVMFVSNWVAESSTLSLNTNPKAIFLEDPPYLEQALGAMALPRDRGF